MSSAFDAPDGPASSMPPPPPPADGPSRVPAAPTQLEAALAAAAALPPPKPLFAAPPAPAPPAPAPPAPATSAPVRPPPGAAPMTVPAVADAPRAGSDLNDLLAQIERDPGDTPAPPPPATTPPLNVLTDPRDLARPATASDIVIESEGGLDFDPNFANIVQRFLGILIDTIVLNLSMIPGLLLLTAGGFLGVLGALVMLGGFIGFVTVTARMIAASGKSLGNRVMGTRVVDGINGANIDVGRAWLRTAVRHTISPILLLGFISGFTDSQRRTFHDRLAGTVVVQRSREVWTAGMPID